MPPVDAGCHWLVTLSNWLGTAILFGFGKGFFVVTTEQYQSIFGMQEKSSKIFSPVANRSLAAHRQAVAACGSVAVAGAIVQPHPAQATVSLPETNADCFLIASHGNTHPPARLPRPTTKPATSRANRAQSPTAARFDGWPMDRCARTVPAQIQAGKRCRTVSAQPHNPAQVFLPIVATRCKIMLAIRGKRLYRAG